MTTKLYDLSDYIKEMGLPPKKKKQLNLDNLTINISFGEKFTNNEKISKTKADLESFSSSTTTTCNSDVDYDNHVSLINFSSPCWCRLEIHKFLDINIFKQ